MQYVRGWLFCWLSGHGYAEDSSLQDLPEELRDRLFLSHQPEPFNKKMLKRYPRLLDQLCWRWRYSMSDDATSGTQEQFLALPETQLLGNDSGLFRTISEANNFYESSEEFQSRFEEEFDAVPCYVCGGSRLNEAARCFRIAGATIADICALPLDKFAVWLEGVEDALDGARRAVANEILKEIRTRVYFLLQVGLGYLSLSRASNSLSGGESQRIRLATQIGTNLVNVLYILDEPSIGLHPRDNT